MSKNFTEQISKKTIDISPPRWYNIMLSNLQIVHALNGIICYNVRCHEKVLIKSYGIALNWLKMLDYYGEFNQRAYGLINTLIVFFIRI